MPSTASLVALWCKEGAKVELNTSVIAFKSSHSYRAATSVRTPAPPPAPPPLLLPVPPSQPSSACTRAASLTCSGPCRRPMQRAVRPQRASVGRLARPRGRESEARHCHRHDAGTRWPPRLQVATSPAVMGTTTSTRPSAASSPSSSSAVDVTPSSTASWHSHQHGGVVLDGSDEVCISLIAWVPWQR